MRFIVMHKVDARMEAGDKPEPRIIQDMGALVQDSLKRGVFTNGAGLHRSARRVRLKHEAGVWSVEQGPYAGGHELVAALAMITARSMPAAIHHAKQLGAALGDCELEIGPVVEPWDLGLIPKPDGARPEKFLILTKSDEADEDSVEAKADHEAATAAMVASFQNDGALLACETLAPSAQGKRLPAVKAGSKRAWVDGPFAETKELIAGFSLLELPSVSEALAWAERYAEILGEQCEVDVRVVTSPAGPAA